MKNCFSCAASSCAVESSQGGARLTFSFFGIGQWIDARKAFDQTASFYVDDDLSSKGSTLVVMATSRTAFEARAALQEIECNVRHNQIAFVNGERRKCPTVNAALTLAFHHS